MDKCLVIERFTSTVPQHGPVISGVISTIPQARYTVKVEIKETDFGDGTSEYANVAVNGIDFGKCTPSGHGTCKWYTCDNLIKKEVIALKDTALLTIRFGPGVDAFEKCDHQVEARITFELTGKKLTQAPKTNFNFKINL